MPIPRTRTAVLRLAAVLMVTVTLVLLPTPGATADVLACGEGEDEGCGSGGPPPAPPPEYVQPRHATTTCSALGVSFSFSVDGSEYKSGTTRWIAWNRIAIRAVAVTSELATFPTGMKARFFNSSGTQIGPIVGDGGWSQTVWDYRVNQFGQSLPVGIDYRKPLDESKYKTPASGSYIRVNTSLNACSTLYLYP